MRPDIHTLTGAYAADALPGEERLAFERHLDDCESCAQEVAELRETAARLGAAAAQAPPPELKRRVLAEIPAVRQLPPELVTLPVGRRWPRLALAAAAVLAVVAVALGALGVQFAERAERAEQTTAGIAAVLAAPDTEIVHAQAEVGGSSTIVVSRSRGAAVFVAEDLPELAESRTYQLWFIGSGGARPAGLLSGRGESGPVVVRGLADAQRLGLTVEPAGGSGQPTSEPLLVVALP